MLILRDTLASLMTVSRFHSNILLTSLGTSAAPAAAPPPADPAVAQGQQAPTVAPPSPAAAATTNSVAALAAMAPSSEVTVSGGAVVPLQSAVTVPLLGKMFHIGPVEGAEEMWL